MSLIRLTTRVTLDRMPEQQQLDNQMTDKFNAEKSARFHAIAAALLPCAFCDLTQLPFLLLKQSK